MSFHTYKLKGGIIMKKRYALVVMLILITTIAIGLVYYKETLQVSFYPLAKHIEKMRIFKYVQGYKTFETENFIIRYKDEDEEYAKLTGKIGEKYYENICNIYGYYPPTKNSIIIYNDEKSLLKNLRFNKGNTPIGVYYSGVIHILSPEIWINSSDNLEQIYEVNGPVVHEFTHLLVDEITRGNYPMWLTEGLALYTEYITTGFEWESYNITKEDINIEDLDNNFHAIEQTSAYRKSFEIVKGMSDTWGFEKLRDVLQILGEGTSINKTAKAVLKINLYDLNKL
ncbi:MAG: hypothetical protein EWM50_05410 [Gottschalkiaceae bacterium]|nr:MAG: hypothetical protein EWM50_05410 [Gottschalkiaceae bacterium]